MFSIAHVDDDNRIRIAVQRILRYGGYDTDQFATPEALLQVISSGKFFDLIISDENMGADHLSGHEFIRLAQEVSPQTKFLILATTQIDNHTADLFLEKPVSREALIQAVAKLLS